jgi:hypothetical protein
MDKGLEIEEETTYRKAKERKAKAKHNWISEKYSKSK